uniref:Wall-associated receptor kinase galacturonan-binding domain-containing protein n=1 Tax=Aegilops tauschii subsp. strangulata TaxID=200361 RepID=A0A453ATZ2_AEGTS
MTTTRSSQSHSSQPLPIILVLLLAAAASTRLILQAAAAAAAAEQDEKQPITLPGCPDRCGDTLIPFPFCTKPGCFREGFQVTCNDSLSPHRAFLAYAGVNQHIAEIYYKVGWHHPVWRTDHGNTALELIDISVADGEARAYVLVSSLCNAANLSGDYVAKCQNLALGERGPFLLSVTRNLLVGVGWRVEPKIMSYLWSAYRNSTYEFSLACLSDLMGMPKLLQLATNGSCSSGPAGAAARPRCRRRPRSPTSGRGSASRTTPCGRPTRAPTPWWSRATGTASPRRTCTASRCCPGGTRGASPSCSTSPSGTVHARGKAGNHRRTTPASAATAIAPTRLVVLPMAMSAGAWNTTMATLTSPMDAKVY